MKHNDIIAMRHETGKKTRALDCMSSCPQEANCKAWAWPTLQYKQRSIDCVYIYIMHCIHMYVSPSSITPSEHNSHHPGFSTIDFFHLPKQTSLRPLCHTLHPTAENSASYVPSVRSRACEEGLAHGFQKFRVEAHDEGVRWDERGREDPGLRLQFQPKTTESCLVNGRVCAF